MFDESQLTMLKRNVTEWNQWRLAHDDEEVRLPGVDLRRAALTGAALNRAVLDGADLSSANLENANLRGASLVGANLMFANLSGASLAHADFRGAKLQHANLTSAGISNANLSEATLGGTVFNVVELGLAIGLETCRHEAFSLIDHSTLSVSPDLPESFLRGCGVPESVITAWHGLSPQRRVFNSCFISYSSADQQFVDRLATDLKRAGIKCWLATGEMQGGRTVKEQIDVAIAAHDRLLLVLSEASMNSEWVKIEIETARHWARERRRRVVFPVSLAAHDALKKWSVVDADTGKDSAEEIREYYVPDFSNWQNYDSYKAAFDKLLNGLKAEEEQGRNE